jgi:hypothetical protein
MSTAGQDRLFVPLTAQAFGWWRSGKKRWEVRRDAPRWGEKHLRAGRRVELRRGYSGPSLWGTLTGAVSRAVSVRELFRGAVEIGEVVPLDRADAGDLCAMLGPGVYAHERWPDHPHPTVVAFEVLLDPGQVEGR